MLVVELGGNQKELVVPSLAEGADKRFAEVEIEGSTFALTFEDGRLTDVPTVVVEADRAI